MISEADMIGYELLKTGTLVAFRILSEEVLNAPADEAEFGMRVHLKFVAEEGEEDLDEDEVAQNTAEWGSFGFLFVLAMLSFSEARPRNSSVVEYEQKDELKLTDFIERLRFVRGELHYDADYIRGRASKRELPCAQMELLRWTRSAGASRCCDGSNACGGRNSSIWSGSLNNRSPDSAAAVRTVKTPSLVLQGQTPLTS